MKTCSLHDFMNELTPWLDKDHIRAVEVDGDGHVVVNFLDGMKNVYQVDDCNREQMNGILAELMNKGIKVS